MCGLCAFRIATGLPTLRLRFFVATTLLFLGILVVHSTDAFACTCLGPTPVCETFWKTPVVFSGEVLDISSTPSKRELPLLANRTVRLRVLESWRGGVSGEIDVVTGSGGGDCGYQFERGKRYLVFAMQHGGVLSTSICSRTQPLADAQDDLAYVRRPFPPSAGGRIYGKATFRLTDLSYSARPTTHPVAGYEVVLKSGATERRATTDNQGAYQFDGVPAGKHTLELIVPATEFAYGAAGVELGDPRGCALHDFNVIPNGRISLRVTNADGSPARGMTLEVAQREEPTDRLPVTRSVVTSDDGVAQFTELPPDRYVIGINISRPPNRERSHPRLFYPSVTKVADARVIDLGLGESIELEPFVLPAPLREIRSPEFELIDDMAALKLVAAAA
jgi:hypothetical protein